MELEKVVSDNFARSLEEHSNLDSEAMANLIDGYNGPVGFLNLKSYIENMMMQQYRASLPSIQNRLLAKKQDIERKSGLGDSEPPKYLQTLTAIFCANVEGILTRDFEDLVGINAERKTMTQEYEEIKNYFPTLGKEKFSYQESSVWRNKKFNTSLRETIYADYPLLGGAQINRLLSEFHICIHCLRAPKLFGDEFKAKVIEQRTSMSKQIGGQGSNWSVIIGELLQSTCSSLLGNDIDFFSIRLKTILFSWFDIAWNSAVDKLKRQNPSKKVDVSLRIREELHKFYRDIIDKWCTKMSSRMMDFVCYSIRDYDEGSFKHRVIAEQNTINFTPSASHLFVSIMQQLAPGKVDLTSSSLIESSICSSNLPDLFHSDSFELKLESDDRPEDPIVLEKIAKICSYQVKFGSERIRATFKFIFESLFKSPLCKKLPVKISRWGTDLPALLKESVKQDNQIIEELDKNLVLISYVLPGNTNIFSDH